MKLNPEKIKVGVFFGGKSAEHPVSIQSAKNVVEALDTDRFTPLLIGIDQGGDWHELTHEQLMALTILDSSPPTTDKLSLLADVDVALPILHGPLGEDGTIQGLFEIADMPFVGPGVLGSAISMDKDVMKRLARDAGIPIAPFRTVRVHEKDSLNLTELQQELGQELFVKPANMGSSVGVNRATTESELQQALETAFQFDTKALIESAVHGSEIECAVLGNLNPEASVIGRIAPREGDFYSYDAKYIDEDGATLEIPAQISESASQAARELAIKTFKTLGCEGMSRVDMFLTANDQLIVNEVNTIPGFTKISMYPKLWEASGLSYTDLITKLIELALERHTRKSSLKTKI